MIPKLLAEIRSQFEAASKNRLAKAVAKAAAAGALTAALAGHANWRTVLGSGAAAAGAAFLNFIKNPQDDTEGGSLADH